jgi:hypothetical protein
MTVLGSLSLSAQQVDPDDWQIASSSSVPASVIAEKHALLFQEAGTTSASPTADTLASGSRFLRKRPAPIQLFGYYRFFGYGRNMVEPYPNLAPFEKAYGVGDGYREPTLSLNLIGRLGSQASFGTELFFLAPYLGTGFEDNVFQTNLGINYYGNFRTKHGSFGIRAGGIHWYNLSQFTLGVYQVLDRFSIFDRTPWEGVTNTAKYDSYYESGAINVGDQRWNFQPFQGLIINGGRLPGNMHFDVFWGKTQPNSSLINGLTDPAATVTNPNEAGNVPTYFGFAGDGRVQPNYIYGGRIGTELFNSKLRLDVNSLNNRTVLDSLDETQSRRYEVHTLSFAGRHKGLELSGELGGGAYESARYAKTWGEALMLRVKLDETILPLPLDVQVYQIDKAYYNPNGEVATFSNREIETEFNANAVAGQIAIGGQITQVNQLVHNRRGFNLNTGVDLKSLKINLGYGLAAELEAQSEQVSFVHRINGLALSRIYNPFPANATSATNFGPYGRKFSFFRGAFETVQTTDLNPATALADQKKFFTTVDLQAKYRTQLGGKSLYLFYLSTYGSANASAAAIPTLERGGYLLTQYHELDLYYEVIDRFILTGYAGLERSYGGALTEWNPETNSPLDQIGTGLGAGFDWTITDNSGLYFRYRWMTFEDKSFPLDQFRGRELTLELKTYF